MAQSGHSVDGGPGTVVVVAVINGSGGNVDNVIGEGPGAGVNNVDLYGYTY